MESIHNNLYKNSKKLLEGGIVEVKNMNDFKKAISDKKLVKALFCGEIGCEDLIKDETGGASSRNIPFGQKLATGKCVHCGKQAKYSVYFGKGY